MQNCTLKNFGQINVKCTNQRILFKLKFTERVWQQWQGMGAGVTKTALMLGDNVGRVGLSVMDAMWRPGPFQIWFVIIWEYFRSYHDHMSHVCHRQMWGMDRNARYFLSSQLNRKKINSRNIQRICKLDFFLLYLSLPYGQESIRSDCRQYH